MTTGYVIYVYCIEYNSNEKKATNIQNKIQKENFSKQECK